MTPQSEPRIERLHFVSFGSKEEKLRAAAKAAIEIKQPEPVIPPPPVFSEAQLHAAKQEAHKQGYGEGYQAAEAKINHENVAREEATKGLLEIIANRITLAAEAQTSHRKRQEEAVASLALAIARKLTAKALKREPYSIAESLLTECMDLVVGQSRLIIAMPKGRADGFKQRMGSLTPLLKGFKGDIQVEEDAALEEYDCRVEWNGGHAIHHAQTIWNDIQAIITKTTFIT